MNRISSALVAVSLLFISGCATLPDPKPGDARYAPVPPQLITPEARSSGSIYASGAGISLWEDKRARRVGDIITLMLEEQTVTSKTNSAAIDKDDSLNMGIDNVFGKNPYLNLLGNKLNLEAATTNTREFEGDAAANQTNSLQGQISVTVVDVLTNGVLVVRGEKWMTFSLGDEFIRIEGLLRPSDVNPDNTAMSNRLADARITYSGTGALANAQVQGWASKFFNSKWWPF